MTHNLTLRLAVCIACSAMTAGCGGMGTGVDQANDALARVSAEKAYRAVATCLVQDNGPGPLVPSATPEQAIPPCASPEKLQQLEQDLAGPFSKGKAAGGLTVGSVAGGIKVTSWTGPDTGFTIDKITAETPPIKGCIPECPAGTW